MLESRSDGNQAEGFGEEYEDEYDDTYDDNAMGEKEPDLDEVLQRRAFVLPQALGGGHIRTGAATDAGDDDDEVGGDDGEDGPNRDKSKIPFCRNPEEMRAGMVTYENFISILIFQEAGKTPRFTRVYLLFLILLNI